LLSFWKKSNDLRIRLLFIVTILASLTVAIPDYFTRQGELISILLTFLLFCSYGVLIGAEPHLAMVIPEKKKFAKNNPFIIVIFYVFGAILSFLFLLNYLSSMYNFNLSNQFKNIVYSLFVITYQLIIPVIVFCILLHTFIKTSEEVKKTQTKIVLFGVLPWMISMVLVYIFVLAVGEISSFLYFLNLFCIIPVPIAFSIAIFKYRLFDVELIIRKSLIYGLLTGFLFLVYYVILGLGSGIFSFFFIKVSSIWIIAFATLFLGLIFNPLRKKIHIYVDKYFYPEKFKLRQELPEISKNIASITTLKELVNQILYKLSNLLNMKSSAFLLLDEKKERFVVYTTKGVIEPLKLERDIIFSNNEKVIQYISNKIKPLNIGNFTPQIKKTLGYNKIKKFQPEIIVPFHLNKILIAILLLGGKHSEGKLDREDRDILAMFSNQAAAMLENARLFQYATFDDLTGLYRRHVFEKELKKEIQRTQRFKRPVVIGIIDIDHFKEINDSYGHASGDIILKNIAYKINKNIRNVDFLARYGGEEFVFILPETNIDNGKKISEKLRKIVENMVFYLDEKVLSLKVTVSIGITCWNGEGKIKTIEELLKNADKALYKAKNRGRNQIQIMI